MRRTNRIEPIHIDPRALTHAVMITTTQLEIVRRIEISPIRIKLPENPPSAAIKHSRKLSWYIGCLFITAGILALSIVITGLMIIIGKMNSMKKNNIERYDLGDLQYGVNNINYSLNTSLSNMNKIFIQKYLSDQLSNIPGYRGLVIDEIFVLNKSNRKQRDTSCSIIFILQNIQIYFDHCSTCLNQRNLILRHLFFNITIFRQTFYLLLNNLHISVQICSTPNISHLITPIRVQSISTSTLLPLKTNSNNISTIVSTTDNPKSTVDNLEESTSFTTYDSSQTSSIDTQSSTSNRFQFLPFRPSITKRYNPNSRTNANR